jgi:olefin beta-lactone synthetase
MKIGYGHGCVLENNVFSFLEKHTVATPDKIIFRWVSAAAKEAWKKEEIYSPNLPHEKISYAEFTPLVQRIAAGYLQLGLKKGDRAIVFLPMGVELYAALFALQMIGAIPVFLDSWARRNQLGSTAQVVDPVAMVSFAGAFAMTATLPEFQSIRWKIVHAAEKPADDFVWLQQLLKTPSLASPVPLEREHTALVTFTTGSSGVPKGANRSHRFLAAQHYAINRNLPYLENDIDLPVFPIFSLNNIAAGVQTVIPAIDVGVPGASDAALLLSQLVSCQATCATFSPSLLNGIVRFCEKEKLALPLRRVAAGGAPISRDNARAFQRVAPKASLEILYGSTEVEPISHIDGKEILSLPIDPDEEIVEKGVPVGTLAVGLSFKIIRVHRPPIFVQSEADWAKWELPAGHPGELIVAGEHVCESYFNNEKAFEGSKIRDHQNTVWHRTGDVALIENGMMWIVGRVHNGFERAGKMLFPVGPEILLKRISGVGYGAYLGVPQGANGALNAVAVVAPRTGVSIDSTKATEEVKRLFSKNKMELDALYCLESLPLDPRHHSKVEYDVLRKAIIDNPKNGLLWERKSQ